MYPVVFVKEIVNIVTKWLFSKSMSYAYTMTFYIFPSSQNISKFHSSLILLQMAIKVCVNIVHLPAVTHLLKLENNRKEMKQLWLSISNQMKEKEIKKQRDQPKRGTPHPGVIPPKQSHSTTTNWIDVEDPGVHYRVMQIDDTQNGTGSETEEIPLSPVCRFGWTNADRRVFRYRRIPGSNHSRIEGKDATPQ